MTQAMRQLAGKTAIITGGTSGIGLALVRRFISEGANVCFTGRREALGADIASETGAAFVKADLRDTARIPAVIGTALEATGRVDILVNNAGDPGPVGALEDIALEDFDNTLAIHLRGAFAMTQAVIPHMKAQGSGVILNMGSITGVRIGGHSQVYAIAKAGMSHMSRAAAVELGPYGIRVNTLSPGYISTDIHGRALGRVNGEAHQFAEMLAPMFVAMQSIPRAGTVGDVADVAVFLSGDQASFITGVDLLVDGGLALGKPKGVMPAKPNRNADKPQPRASSRPQTSAAK
ncbi:MAG: SDR family oxidoreductase [Rhodobiaceae bacterium]|nr:SDR family oxidoreductase [Rhodobiaceae bacterium]MCC0011855.1 SDR family oxidoreductase [Rhodobiaceae bacterium]MCC0050488.1 SDR family oxidoreductase [Rhodobiaceae bacterium]MCC0061227.1 SDR family oxidoreductase [Rhodobiaceae bacterium]